MNILFCFGLLFYNCHIEQVQINQISPIFANDTVFGKVVRILDGDTFEILHKNNHTEKIRLHGVDCPENNQPFSKAAHTLLANLIFAKEVTIIRMDNDRYGRTIAMVYVNGLNINETLLSAGLAWHFKKYDQNPKWDKLEKKAANDKIGLWADPTPTPPWEWRRIKAPILIDRSSRTDKY